MVPTVVVGDASGVVGIRNVAILSCVARVGTAQVFSAENPYQDNEEETRVVKESPRPQLHASSPDRGDEVTVLS